MDNRDTVTMWLNSEQPLNPWELGEHSVCVGGAITDYSSGLVQCDH